MIKLMDIKEITLKELMAERPDLVQAIKNGEDKNETASHIEKDEKGRVKKWTEETRDLDGILISRRIDEYSYYETGEVDIITQQVYDNKGELVSEKKVKYFKDGKQPIIEKTGY